MITKTTVLAAARVKRLGEVVDFLDSMRRPVTESERRPGSYPYFGANGQQGTIDRYIFDEPLVLLAEDGGHFDMPSRGIAYRISGKTWVNNHAHVLRPTSEVDIGFLCRVLENYDVSPWVTGTTRGKLTQAGAAEILIPLPSLGQQRRIAEILDKADTLRAKRRAVLAELDTLTQSILLDMFGDRSTILKRWTVRRLEDHLTFLTSGSRGWADYYDDTGDVFLRIQNVRRDELLIDDIARVRTPQTAEAARTRVMPGDILLSITADLGRTAVVPEGFPPAFINQHLAILRLKGVESRFVSAFLSSSAGQLQVQTRNRQGVKAGLNFDDIRSLLIPVPPHDAQRAFARAASSVDRLKNKAREAERTAAKLFASLQHRAFRGEL